MPRGIVKFVTLLAVMQLLGLHWAGLQAVAWVGMFARNVQSSSTAGEAFVKTFDGQHPCSLCHAVKQGRADEQKSDDGETVRLLLSLEAVLTHSAVLPIPSAVSYRFSTLAVESAVSSEPPLLQPPRVRVTA